MTSSIIGIDVTTKQRVDIPKPSRLRGLYIIGAPGTGKSGLIENLIIQDIEQDIGVCLLDPHGDLTQAVLARLPDRRVKDVIFLDIADYHYPFGLNLFACSDITNPLEVQRTVDQVMHVFEKLFAVSHDTPLILEYLQNCTHTLIVNPGYTMADIPLLFLNEQCRRKLVANVMDTDVRLFWQQYDDKKPSERSEEASSTLRRVREFLQPLSRAIVGQAQSTLDMRFIMDERKILLVKLDPRLEMVTSLIGSLIIAQFLNAAYSRADLPLERRKQFNLYADEFQRFATEDFATLFTEARKFGIALTVAHQMRDQLDRQNRGATVNVANLVVFQVSSPDADELAGEFDCTPPPAETRLEPELTFHPRPWQYVIQYPNNYPRIVALFKKYYPNHTLHTNATEGVTEPGWLDIYLRQAMEGQLLATSPEQQERLVSLLKLYEDNHNDGLMGIRGWEPMPPPWISPDNFTAVFPMYQGQGKFNQKQAYDYWYTNYYEPKLQVLYRDKLPFPATAREQRIWNSFVNSERAGRVEQLRQRLDVPIHMIAEKLVLPFLRAEIDEWLHSSYPSAFFLLETTLGSRMANFLGSSRFLHLKWIEQYPQLITLCLPQFRGGGGGGGFKEAKLSSYYVKYGDNVRHLMIPPEDQVSYWLYVREQRERRSWQEQQEKERRSRITPAPERPLTPEEVEEQEEYKALMEALVNKYHALQEEVRDFDMERNSLWDQLIEERLHTLTPADHPLVSELQEKAMKEADEAFARVTTFIADWDELTTFAHAHPIKIASGQYIEKPVLRTFADMRNEIASRLVKLDQYTARVKIASDGKSVEHVIQTLNSKKESRLGDAALKTRIAYIQANNIRDGYCRQRSDVEVEIKIRQELCSEPADEPPSSPRRKKIT